MAKTPPGSELRAAAATGVGIGQEAGKPHPRTGERLKGAVTTHVNRPR